MEYMSLVVTLILQSVQCVWCFTISISGETYIEAGVPYMVTCNVSHFVNNRITTYSTIISDNAPLEFIIAHSTAKGCYYEDSTASFTICPSSLCACDTDGLATHWIYTTPTDLSSTVTFICTSTDINNKLHNSELWTPTAPYGPGLSIAFNPANESVTKVLGQSLGPIICSAQCSPPCQFHWTNPDGTVVDESNLEISSLSKYDHGTFTCHAGNGYGNNATKNILLTVNYGPESVTLSPPTTTYNVTEGDTIPSISCNASCRPQCTVTWTGPNVPSNINNNLHLQNININHKGTFYCTAINAVGSNVSSNVVVDVRYGPGSSVSFNPETESITKVLGQSLGPIICSTQCNPKCRFHWIKPNGTVIDGSNLTIPSLSKKDHGTFTCHAGNGYGNSTTKNLLMTVNYEPEYVTLSPSTTMYTVTEGDTIPSITCNASCRPQCTFMWTGPNVPDGTTNNLHLQNINRNQTGTFNCTATNAEGSKMSSSVKVDIRYQARVKNVAVNTTNTVDENTTVMFTSLIEGSPAPTVTWSLNGKILQTTEESTTKSSFMIDFARCNNTGSYTCTANNIIGISEKQLMLYVTCNPRSAIIPGTQIAIRDKNGALNITVPIIAYPQPTSIRWTFRQNGTTNITDIESNYTTTTYGVYQHVSQLIKDNVTDSEYGEYSINVSNNIDPDFTHDFTVVAERRPDRPSNVSAVCDSSPFSTTISWKLEYNGGGEQTFSIWFKINSEKEHIFELHRDNILDEGRNKYITMHITSLQASTAYTFYVNSSNMYGFSKSNHVFCNTTAEKTHADYNTAFIGIVAGTSSAIVVVIVVVVIVIIRHRCASDADNGLKDNILYESAGSDFVRKTISTGVEGAVVPKKGNTLHANGDDMIRETGLYAEAKKKPKLGQTGEIHENTKNTGKAKGKDNMKKYKDGDVHENMEDKVGNGRPTSQSTDKRNKDGLQYTELMFNPSPSGARFIIHGQEDKTMYADVDTAHTIDPLPDSDVEEDQNITNSNNTKD